MWEDGCGGGFCIAHTIIITKYYQSTFFMHFISDFTTICIVHTKPTKVRSLQN